VPESAKDKAATASDNAAYTAGVLTHMLHAGGFVIEHFAHDQWSALERERKIKLWAEQDRTACMAAAKAALVRSSARDESARQQPPSSSMTVGHPHRFRFRFAIRTPKPPVSSSSMKWILASILSVQSHSGLIPVRKLNASGFQCPPEGCHGRGVRDQGPRPTLETFNRWKGD
jgi:hypothetical protein